MHASNTKTYLSLIILLFVIHIKTVSHWHDHYRMVQVILIIICTGYIFFGKSPWIIFHSVPNSRILMTILLAAGLASSARGMQPIWALTEVALTLGGFGVVNALLRYAHAHGATRWDKVLVVTTFLFSRIFLLGAVWIYGKGLLQHTLNTHQLAATFDNPRFLGQVITLALLIMGAYLLTPAGPHHRFWRLTLPWLIFAGTWGLVIATGTRGTWLAMGAVALIASVTGQTARRWVKVQLLGAAAGLALTSLLIYGVPQWLNVAITNAPEQRLHLGLSAREIIWGQAWEMIQSAPWLGHGPMHFAQLHSVAGAHPHQLLLQFAAEWGLVATACLCALTGWALVAMLRRMVQWQRQGHAHTALYIGLSTAVAAALVQSMVDGVWVMPYTQTALTAVAAFAFALHHQEGWAQHPPSTVLTLWDKGYTVALLLACAVLLYSLWPGSATSLHQSLTVFELPQQFKPRYWVQGFI